MSTKNIIMSMTFLSLILASGASGNPVLLASYEHHVDSGGAPMANPQAEFALQLGVYEWEARPEIRALGGGIFWKDGDYGTITFNEQNCSTFLDFTSMATNGNEEDFRIWDLNEVGGGITPYISESQILQTAPDLVGYELLTVLMIVNSVHFETWIPEVGIQGYLYQADVTWQFYGSAVPEVRSCEVMLLMVLYVIGRKR